MDAILGALTDLNRDFGKQLELYQQLSASYQQEQALIAAGRVDHLMPIIQAKQQLLAAITDYEPGIQEKQQQIMGFFGVVEFSISQIRDKASEPYHAAIDDLQATLRALITNLEQIESQERTNERQLQEYLPPKKPQLPGNKQQARRGYNPPPTSENEG